MHILKIGPVFSRVSSGIFRSPKRWWGVVVSNFSIVQSISAELRRQIIMALDATPDSDFGVDGNVEKVAFESPAANLPESTLASLFLFHIGIDGHRRNQRPLPDPDADDQFRKPPLPLRLRYLFTPVSAEEATNQLLIGRLIQHFHDQPSFDTLSGVPLGDSHGGAPRRILVRFEMFEIEQLTQIWSAFSKPWRLTLPLLIETAAIDSARPPQQLPRVDQFATGVGQTPRRRG